MGLRHLLRLLEVSFHPEAELTEHGREMIGNFVSFCREFHDIQA
jgi:anthranilate/para-aminobenzoate synthase component II